MTPFLIRRYRLACWACPSALVNSFFRCASLTLFSALTLPGALSLQPGSMNRVPVQEKLAEVHWQSPWSDTTLWSFAEPPRPAGEVEKDYTSGAFYPQELLKEWRRKDPFLAFSRNADTRAYTTSFWDLDDEDWASPSDDEDEDEYGNRNSGKSWWAYLMEGLSIPRMRVA